MRRIATLATVIVLAGVAPALAGPGAHTERADYRMPGGVQGVANGSTNLEGTHLGFVQIPSSRRDHAVRITVTDVTTAPVAFSVAQWLPKGEKALGSFCDRSPRLRLPARGRSVVVYLNVGSCPDGPSAPTTGTVTAAFR